MEYELYHVPKVQQGCPVMKVKFLVCAFALSVSATASHAAVLYNNGPVVDSSGRSILAAPSTTFGFGAQTTSNNTVADNFSVTGASWNVSSLDFYSYQSLANGFTFTDAKWSIVAGSNVNTGTTVVSGTTSVTNAGLLGYRVTSTTLTNQDRAIYRLNADIPDFVLSAGNYFITWSLAGTGTSGPWVPPVVGSLGTGNALQSLGGAVFNAAQDSGSNQSYDMPFSINGTIGSSAVPEPTTWAMMIAGSGLIGASMRYRRRFPKMVTA